MSKIPDYKIDEIRDKISISEIVSQYVTLTKKGGRLWGLCPFHTEKTPSFTVQEEQGFFHCFGCGKGGSVFNFVMDIENLNFVEAVEYLAEKAGVELTPATPEQTQKQSEKQALYELYNRLTQSFHYILQHRNEGKAALDYLRGRKISSESIREFQIGYAPADPNWLYTFLKRRKYSDAFLQKSGVFSKNNVRYPLFRDRIMFPIVDQSGRVIAFGGRALDEGAKAKYLNTPETSIFHKRESLFGLHQSLPHIKKNSTFIVCEGYFDVIAMHQAGVKTVVAPLGTAFTSEQTRRLKRYASHGQLLFDSDSAGREAAKKAILEMEKMEMATEVLQIHEKDPSEILENNQEDLLKNLPKQGISCLDFLISDAKGRFNGSTPDDKLSIFNEVRPYLDSIQSDIKLSGSLQKLAEEIHVEEQILWNEINKHSSVSTSDDVSKRENLHMYDAPMTTELYLMLTVVNNRDYFPTVRGHVHLEHLEDERAREIYTALEESLREGETSFDSLLNRIEQPQIRQLITEHAGSEEYAHQTDMLISDLLNRYRLQKLENKRSGVVVKIREEEKGETDIHRLQELLYEKKHLDEEITKLRKH